MSPTQYDRYLDDFGAQVSRVAAPDPDPVRPPRRRLALGLGGTAVAAAAIVAAVLAVGGGAAGERLDAVAEAQAALNPEGGIVHLRLRSSDVPTRGPGDATVVSETWSDPAADAWRTRSAGSAPADGEEPQGPLEMSYADGTLRVYVTNIDTLRVQRIDPADGPVMPLDGLEGLGPDPVQGLRDALARGEFRDEGEVSSGGRTVRRLVATDVTDARSRTITYDVDPESFAPVAGRVVVRTSDGLEVVRSFTVPVFETLEGSAENRRLLDIPTTADTRVIVLDRDGNPVRDGR
ncbi:hypothetical protein GKE82_09205 [Conexibacter sp. W3-3-2]|uniref:hypothetical protein n=1 Tax=Conexibacter sp. W3-3-2 TaxID=2675227 RepID=UPI0012B9DEF8|nr:hypothetical protein [Conexibacter sp. W3-3-2]MTD44463.1 hypothetical protein [Conexibacter sp. W3-3-2]